jgi:hypothetical protein
MTLDLEVLELEHNRGYGPRPIPVDRDSEIDEVVRRGLTAAGYAQLRAAVAPGHHAVLRAWAERMASFAVRQASAEPLAPALVALALGGLDDGSREALAVLPLVYRSAELVGEDPAGLFQRAAAAVGETAAAELRRFLTRGDRSIRSMGYVEDTDEDGFRYRRTW